VPGIVEAALALPVRSVVLDGEAIALRDDGRPHAFQDTASRGHRLAGAVLRRPAPRRRGRARRAGRRARRAARRGRADALRVPRRVAADAEAAGAVLDDALAMGHEGVIVKSLDAPYAAGRRGAGWLKVKPVHTLDLVILAAEWGHGRRRGWLSNLHLGARTTPSRGSS
jgi:DNA ligase-1